MSDTKEIILTGDAVTIKGGKRRSRKGLKIGGGSTQGAIVQLQSTSSSSESSTANVEGLNPSKIAEISAPVVTGGAKPKVILKAPTKKDQKVVLSASKANILKPITFTNSKNKTKKMCKKINFSLKKLRKKLKVAKTIKKSSEEKSLDEIKKILEDIKLIKVDSKAPESMIRQIYNDYMTMKHKSL